MPAPHPTHADPAGPAGPETVDSVVGLAEALDRAGAVRGGRLAVAVAPGVGVGLAGPTGSVTVAADVAEPAAVVAWVERELRPRWVQWSGDQAVALVRADVRVATAWDLAAVHRLLFGGWRAEPARIWARLHGLSSADLPAAGPQDLFSQAVGDDDADPEGPVRPDGHLRGSWTDGGWADSPARVVRWAELARRAAELQDEALAALDDRPRAATTARSESAAELLCAELTVDGLPVDRDVAGSIIAGFVGPRPRTDAEAATQRAERDAEVLRHAAPGAPFDLRSPGQVRSLLRSVGVEVADTRAWRLEQLRGTHPIIDALLVWRKAERVSTTYGYGWLDEHVSPDGRLRGSWSGSDGAAGRMTASAGLHNLPADLRGAVVAEPGHVFVRADLGQIEPRVLAAVSGDRSLARASQEADMYAPVAQQLGVDRATAKVAVLGAMYGQTTGHGAAVLPRLHASYPVAMAYLDAGDRSGQVGQSLRTYGGRLIRMGVANANEVSERDARAQAAARGRFGRNALVQGAAAELFKVWAVTVRARGADIDARIVLCLHDELLVHVPEAHGPAAAALVDDALQEAAHRWAPDGGVRFVADTSVIARWADAKD